MTIHATYKNGAFTPSGPVDLPDGAEVSVDVQIIGSAHVLSPAMAKVYEILSRRHDDLPSDLSERHNEHRP